MQVSWLSGRCLFGTYVLLLTLVVLERRMTLQFSESNCRGTVWRKTLPQPVSSGLYVYVSPNPMRRRAGT